MTEKISELIATNLKHIPDFPEKGILFHDIVPLLVNGEAFRELIKSIADKYRGKIDVIAGLESRGFILAAPLAYELGIGMIPVRKAGKLPGEVIGVDYNLEYGTARLEMSPDTVKENDRVLIIDDVLATGGTASAAVQLLKKCGGNIQGLVVLMELTGLNGREKLKGIDIEAYLQFEY